MYKSLYKISKPLSRVIENKFILIPLIIINLIATVLSFLTYTPGIFDLPWYFQIFKPLCPTYMGLFTFLLLFYAFKKRFPKILTELTFIVVFSLGIISGVFYYLWLKYTGFSIYHFQNMLTHPILALESLILVPFLKKLKPYQYLLIASWVVLDFYMLIGQELFTYFDNPKTLIFKTPVVLTMALLLLFSFTITLLVKEK